MYSLKKLFFWSTHSGAEIDLVIFRGNKRLGFGFKRTAAPALNSSIKTAIKDLNLSHVYIIYLGDKIYPLYENVTALGLSKLTSCKELLTEF